MRCLSAARVQHAISSRRLSLRQRQPLHELAVAGGAPGEPAAEALPALAACLAELRIRCQPSHPPAAPQLQLPCRERRRRAAGRSTAAG